MRELAKHNSSLLFEKETQYIDKVPSMPYGINENDGKIPEIYNVIDDGNWRYKRSK